MAMSTVVFLFFALVLTQAPELTVGAMHSTVKCIDKERIALTTFKKFLTDESNRLSSWIGQECCEWEGVTCSNKTSHVVKIDLHNPNVIDYARFQDVVDHDEYAAIYSKTCLRGEISPSLLDLKQLQYLDLSMNNFSGFEIPKFLGSLTYLRYLNLSAARFEGKIPPHIGNLSHLEYLDLSDFWMNRLTSHSIHWISRVSSLKHLDFSGVQLGEAEDWLVSINMLPALIKVNFSNTLVGSIPPLSNVNFTSLVSLDLQWNMINSAIPSWLFNISGLVELRLDGNGFYGSIPQNLEKLVSLRVLGLSSNFLNSSMPNTLLNLSSLSYLDLSQNKFQGTIADGILNLCKLKFLDLTENRFTGEIPDLGVNEDGCLQDLEYLRLSYNLLTGPIPGSLGTLLNLRELDFQNNRLSGGIPLSLGLLSNLEKLDLSNNSLSGMVTELHLAKLINLIELSMSLNDLFFNVSSDWIPPFQLHAVNLASCTIGPRFPSWLRTQQNVTDLRMPHASITDTLPDWFEKLYSRVKYLDVSNNNISGRLPQFQEANNTERRLIFHSNNIAGPLRPLPSDIYLFDVSNNGLSGDIPAQNASNMKLGVLILSNNQLTGLFPSFLCDAMSMTILDLANNQFHGPLPECIGDMENLSMLDLTNNTLHGEIPSSLSNLSLMSLHLNNNSFEGKLVSLENMTFLSILDVGRNSFTGTIPQWIGERLQYLKFLSLQSNGFYGDIPQNLCQLPQLQLLNLASNNISGQIPKCIKNLTGMIEDHSAIEYLILDVDYGGSILEIVNGIERRYTKTMPFLTSLDLSNNNIVGEIPHNITKLIGLRNLDLAGNNLTGRIPEDIGAMQELISLDLSRNNLSGQIPSSLSSLNYLTHLNLSYNGLSGRIPTGNQLQVIEDPSIYVGNKGLCGAPILKSCDGDAAVPPVQATGGSDEDGDDSLFPWFYAGIGPGFLVGFLIVVGTLHFVKSWRYLLFDFVESVVTTTCIQKRSRRGRIPGS
ncbi:receptor-like protein EIX1 [Primulina huaijiensis]|uniref:receptor-like protein EIX1 n=1 Tax=Primulina huaijiensis TaxID=1492673 RepID=UPI003CC6EA5E